MYRVINSGKTLLCSSSLAGVLVFLNKERQRMATGQTLIVEPDGHELHVLTSQFSKIGVDLGAKDPKECFLKMLDEVDRLYIRPDGEVLQPWQMLPDNWQAFVALGSVCYDVYPCFTPEQRHQRLDFEDREGNSVSNTLCYFMSCEMFRRFGYGHSGPSYGPEKDSNSRHEVHVAYALADGMPVPEHVIAWYLNHPAEVNSIGKWFKLLLEQPAYRGKIPANKLNVLVTLLHQEKPPKELTVENAPYFIQLMSELVDDVNFGVMDDFLYGNGVLKPMQVCAAPVAADLTKAYSPFALDLRNRIANDQMCMAIKDAHTQRQQYGRSLRQTELAIAQAKLLEPAHPLEWANRVAMAVDQRNIALLLDTLDTPDDWNAATKKLIHQHYGVKLLGLKAAARRAAIFELCGMDSDARAAYEKESAEKAAAAKHAREIEQIRERAAQAKWRTESGEVISGAEYVDRAIANGYTTLSVRKQGVINQYWLSNLSANRSVNILAKDGTLDYARLIHGVQELRKAA